MADDLLPSNATDFEKAFSRATDESARVAPGIAAMRTAKLVSIPDSFLPFLVYEYGLGEVSAYIRDLRRLLVYGVDWQRVRGTPEAINFALDWMGNAATLDEAPHTRARWNLFQLALGTTPATISDLDATEALVSLSVPVRSHFWRAYRGHDVRELEWSQKRWGRSAWSSSSGRRVRPGGVKWSFGRTHDFELPVPQVVLEALGAWVPPVGSSLGWGGFAWDDTSASWVSAEAQDRTNAITAALMGRRVSVVLRRPDGSVIGHRLARAVHPVSEDLSGQYEVRGTALLVDHVSPTGLYIEALTGFGDGAGELVGSVSLCWDMQPLDMNLTGRLWLPSGEFMGGTEVLSQPMDLTLRETSRERLRFYLTF